jgi:hypothetical protein
MNQPHGKKSECPTFSDDLAQVRAELERRGRNEVRNCINYAPCSRCDGRMEDVG